MQSVTLLQSVSPLYHNMIPSDFNICSSDDTIWSLHEWTRGQILTSEYRVRHHVDGSPTAKPNLGKGEALFTSINLRLLMPDCLLEHVGTPQPEIEYHDAVERKF